MRGFLAIVGSLLLATGSALAHTGHGGHGGTTDPNVALPLALFVGGGLVLGTAVYLDHAGQLEGRLADFGVLLGAIGVVTGIALALV